MVDGKKTIGRWLRNMTAKIGLIGGTGPQGRGIALRFAKSGIPVIIGSRREEKGKKIAQELNEKLNTTIIEGTSNEKIFDQAKYIFLTVPFEHAAETLKGLVNLFKEGHVFVDVTVPLEFKKGYVDVMELEEKSGSEHLKKILPEEIPFVGAFKTLAAHALEDLSNPLNRDVFVFGNKEARKEVAEVINKIEGLNAVICGPIQMARAVERMTALAITINKKNKYKDSGFKLVVHNE